MARALLIIVDAACWLLHLVVIGGCWCLYPAFWLYYRIKGDE